MYPLSLALNLIRSLKGLQGFNLVAQWCPVTLLLVLGSLLKQPAQKRVPLMIIWLLGYPGLDGFEGFGLHEG